MVDTLRPYTTDRPEQHFLNYEIYAKYRSDPEIRHLLYIHNLGVTNMDDVWRELTRLSPLPQV